jgi:dodecin
MADVYKSIDLVGVSKESFADATRVAVRRAGGTVRGLRWFEVLDQRGHVEAGEVDQFQVTVRIWFELEE